MAQEDESEPLETVFMPPLVELLKAGVIKKGAPLKRREVLKIRDRGVCVRLPVSRVRELEENRGYRDIDPENCWEEWRRFQEQRD